MAGDLLPADGPVQVGPVPLPAGRRVLAGLGSGQPVAWATIEPVPDAGRAWLALTDLHRQSGLVPILISGLDDHGTRPWDAGEFEDPADVAQLDRMDASVVLGTSWDGVGSAGDDAADGAAADEDAADGDGNGDEGGSAATERAPFGRAFPGLAPPGDRPLTAAELQAALARLPASRLALVPASRPADALPLIGWGGVTSRWGEATPVAAVLRSWEARFDARLLRVGFDHIQVLAQRPPRDPAAAERVAAEHYALCDECCGTGERSIATIGARLLESPVWSFRWR